MYDEKYPQAIITLVPFMLEHVRYIFDICVWL